MALFAIAYASFKRLGIYKKCDLDVILMNGDQLYKTRYARVGSVQINVEYTINKYGTLRNGTVSAEELSEIFRSVSDELQEKSALFFVQPFCFAIYFKNHSLHIFDSQPKF